MRRLLDRLTPPALIGGVFALNGLLNLVTGLEPLFERTFYVGVEDVPDYLVLSSTQKVSGLLSVFLGLVMIALAKGLFDGRRRAWWGAITILAVMMANNLYRGTTPETVAVSAVLLVGLVFFRRHFSLASDVTFDYAQVVALFSVLFAMAYGIGGVYVMRKEFGGVETVIDAVYFTFVTFSTVGYGDLLPLTDNAKIFTLSMILVGLASFATALTVVLAPAIEQKMKGVLSLMNRFQRLTDHVVVCGYSSVSESVIEELQERGAAYLIIEDRPDLVRHLQSKGHDVFAGDPTRKETLVEANLAQAVAIVVAYDSDSVNTLVAVTAKEFRDDDPARAFRILVRIESEENIRKVEHIGIDQVISPSTVGGRLMAQRAVEPRTA